MTPIMLDYVTEKYVALCNERATLQRAVEEGFDIDQSQWQRVCKQKKLAGSLIAGVAF